MDLIYNNFIHIWLAIGIKTVITENCGNVFQSRDVSLGEMVKVTFLPKHGQTANMWHFSLNGTGPNLVICWNSNSSCTSQKYHLHRDTLTVNNFTRQDAGHYTVKCKYGEFWSLPAIFSIKLADKSASNKQQDTSKERANEYSSTTLGTSIEEKKTEKTEIIGSRASKEKHPNNHTMTHGVTTTAGSKPEKTKVIATSAMVPLKNTSTESTNVYSSMSQSETDKVESEKETIRVTDTATDYKVSSTLEDRSQVTTIVVAGVVAVGLMLTVIAVAIICKKYKKNSSHQASQKSAGRSHSRQSSERETSALQYEAEHNSGSLYDQQASGSVAEQINSEYATVVPTQDRISGTQQRDINKVVVKEEEGSPEYATVVKSREPVCRVEQSVQGGKDKNEHGLVYADLDLVSRPRRDAASKEHETTEYVSIDFQKTATLKSQQKK